MQSQRKESLHEAAGAKRPKRLKGPQPFFRAHTKSWYVQLGRRQINLGRDPQSALQKYHEVMADRHDVEATVDVTVCAVLDAFLDWVKDWRTQRTYEWYAWHLSGFAKHVGPKLKLLDLGEKHVTTWIDERHKNSAADTIYGAIRSVQRAMNWSVKRGYIPRSPVKGVEKPQQEPREAVISLEQYERIIERCADQNARDLFTVLWETGCRVQEIRQVEARHFDPKQRCWTFPRTKSKGKRAIRVIFLTDTAYEITERLAAEYPSGPIFRNGRGEPWTKNAIVLRFRKIAKPRPHRCGFCTGTAVAYLRGPYVPKHHKQGRKRFHVCQQCVERKELTKAMLGEITLPIPGLDQACATSFRHSFATRALKNRVAGITVSVLMGHSDTRMIDRVYSHLEHDPAFLREELKRATASDGETG